MHTHTSARWSHAMTWHLRQMGTKMKKKTAHRKPLAMLSTQNRNFLRNTSFIGAKRLIILRKTAHSVHSAKQILYQLLAPMGLIRKHSKCRAALSRAIALFALKLDFFFNNGWSNGREKRRHIFFWLVNHVYRF